MTVALYHRVDYQLDHLLMDIEVGKLGLPDLQRPFVWSNVKVRSLFDSMIRGYPIGYLMLWDSPNDSGNRKQIGIGNHAYDAPKTLIIDGQQRLTSLYAVMHGKKVLDSKFNEKEILIAFNPLTKEFQVSSNIHRRSPEWIGNISEAYANDKNTYAYINDFIERLKESRNKNGKTLSSEECQTISNNITELIGLENYLIPTLSITDQADEEDVADIFVRVNSGGAKLNENDFILTLISVTDEAERERIEKFCAEATIPVKGGTSYNQLFVPKPSHIVRVAMAFGFDRARLKYAYMILRGKDMETGIYDPELKKQRFNELQATLNKVLDLNNWHDFIDCVISSGYRSHALIAADNTLVYNYVMYLKAKYKFKMESSKLRRLIARWYYMTSVTTYYSGSYESTVQTDLNNIKDLKTAEDFKTYIDHKIEATFTDDFFNITLPEALNSSTATSPAWNAYVAAQNVLDAKALFSTMSVKDLFTPGSSGTKSAVEKHHLWPKAYLPTIGITRDTERNQIANFAYIEWKDNLTISDEAPEKYWPAVTKDIDKVTLQRMMEENAIPDNWTEMTYSDFLEKRRKLMAQIIKEGYGALTKL